MHSISRVRKAAYALVAGAALAVAPALSASAHVNVSSPDAAPGKTATLVFRVPVESDTANTVSITITLPEDTPFRSVSALDLPGWTSAISRTQLDTPVEVGGATLTEVATMVTFTADGEGLAPGEYGKFEIRVGPMPEAGGTLYFPTLQTYSDGEVSDWSEIVAAGQPEPERPAPALTVAADGAAAPEGDGHGAVGDGHGAEGGTADSPAAEAAAEDGSDGTARVLGVVGIAVGALGVLTGLALGRRRPTVAA